jgi:hypothetical protein
MRMTPLSPVTRRIAGLFLITSIGLATGALAAGVGNFGTGSFGGRGGGMGGGSYGGELTGGGGEAVGLGDFSRFPVRITLALQEGYDDNVFTRSFVQQGSAFTTASVGLDYQFGSTRTELEARAGGGLSYYYDRPGESGPDYNAFFGLTLTHKFNARLSLDISAYTTYQTEPDFSLDIGINRRSGSYFYTSDHFKFSYQFSPRLSTALNYNITTLIYDNSVAGALQNRIENTIGDELRYLLLPTTTLVGEYRISLIDYMDADSSAITHYFLGGFDHSFSPRFNVTFRGGVQLREFDSTSTTRQNGDRFSPDLESTISYQLGERSELSWTNRYGIQEGEGSSTNSIRTSYRTGLNIKYDITPRISSRFALYYTHNSLDAGGVSSGFERDGVDVALTLRYALVRYLGISAGYNRTDVFSSATTNRDYSRNRIYAGIDFVF